MTVLEFQRRIIWIPLENQQNHVNPRTSHENDENHANPRTPFENHENHENHAIPS